MRVYLSASNRAGLAPPWPYVRAQLAEHWHVLPPVVDELPMDEIALQLRLWAIEAECRPPPRRP